MSLIVARSEDTPAEPSPLERAPNREQVLQLILAVPEVRAWDELAEVVACPFQFDDGRTASWEYPRLACEAVGASSQQALPAMVAVGCLHVAIGLVDDMLDGDSDGLYHRLGSGRTANLAAACQAAASQVLAMAPIPAGQHAAAHETLTRVALATAYGQDLDAVGADELGEESYWRVTDAKTPPLFGAALQLGAILGGADLDLSRGLAALGKPIGRSIQVSDDLKDALETPACPDWRRPGTNLALLYTLLAEHQERSRFRQLLARVDEPEALDEAQQIVVRSGAVSYCCYRLLSLHEDLRSRIELLSLHQPEKLTGLADEQILPLIELFEAHRLAIPDLHDFETAAHRAR